MRTLSIALSAMLVMTMLGEAEAARSRPRVVVQKPSPLGFGPSIPGLPGQGPVAPVFHPYWFQHQLEVMLCTFVAYSVPPDTPAGSPKLGKCPPRATPRYLVATR